MGSNETAGLVRVKSYLSNPDWPLQMAKKQSEDLVHPVTASQNVK